MKKVNWKMLALGIYLGLTIAYLWVTLPQECKTSSSNVPLKCVER